MRICFRTTTLFALFLLPGQSLAAPVRIAVGTGVACVLRGSLWTGGESQVKCWGIGGFSIRPGLELKVPTLNHTTEIAASRAAVCALDNGRIRCWGYVEGAAGTDFAKRTEEVFGPLTHITHLSGGVLDFCVTDAVAGARCVHDAAYVTTPQDNLMDTHANPPSPGLTESGYGLACTLGSDQKSYCWATEHNACGVNDLASPQFQLPTELTVAPGSYKGCRPCVLDQGKVTCWGTPEQYEHFTQPSGLKDPHQLAQIDVRRHGGLDVRPCVIDSEEVKCRQDDGSYQPDSDYAGFAHPVALAGNDSAQCAANDQTLLCYFGAGGEEFATRVPHGLFFQDFSLAQLPQAMKNAAASTYADKSALFSEGARLLEADSSLALFLLHAFQPVIDGVGSEFFEHFVKPNWNRLREAGDAQRPAHALKDFLAELPARRAGLSLLRVAIPLLRNREPAAEWDAVLPALANALATDGSTAQAKALAEAFAPLRPRLSAIALSTRDGALAAFVTSLLGGMAP